VSEALAASQHVVPWLQIAFKEVQRLQQGPCAQLYLNLGLQILHGWCELGSFPLVLPQHDFVVQQVCLAVIRSETATLGAETMVSMLQVCKDTTTQGNDVLLSLVQQWQSAVSVLHYQQQQQASGSGGGQQQAIARDVHQALCSVLCAAGSALLPSALTGASVLHVQFVKVAEQLLEQLTHSDDDVGQAAAPAWKV
jgi:hypothetical protein